MNEIKFKEDKTKIMEINMNKNSDIEINNTIYTKSGKNNNRRRYEF